MIDKEEMFSMRMPSKDIVCKDCAHRLKDVIVQGETYERYTFGTCLAFKHKPLNILWGKGPCELYTKE